MGNILHKELSYRITGFCFKIHNELGRFCREKQYADRFEEVLKSEGIPYSRELEINKFNNYSPLGNRIDFLIADKIIVDFKAKKFVTKEDYIQMHRYLRGANLDLGMIVNFRNTYLKPKRILNNDYSNHSDVNSDNSDRMAK